MASENALPDFTPKNLKRLWILFRDYKPADSYFQVHVEYCVSIQAAIGAGNTAEALYYLKEGIAFFLISRETKNETANYIEPGKSDLFIVPQ